eukprot:scaffold129607_cov28-Tisochrysis_lutea.AAC.4
MHQDLLSDASTHVSEPRSPRPVAVSIVVQRRKPSVVAAAAAQALQPVKVPREGSRHPDRLTAPKLE